MTFERRKQEEEVNRNNRKWKNRKKKVENKLDLLCKMFLPNLPFSFWRFLKDKDVRKKWEVALRREGFTASDSSVLCSEHFKQDDLDRTPLGGYSFGCFELDGEESFFCQEPESTCSLWWQNMEHLIINPRGLLKLCLLFMHEKFMTWVQRCSLMHWDPKMLCSVSFVGIIFYSVCFRSQMLLNGMYCMCSCSQVLSVLQFHCS